LFTQKIESEKKPGHKMSETAAPAQVHTPVQTEAVIALLPESTHSSHEFRHAGMGFPSGDGREVITVAILAKDKAHSLPVYLKCLEAQTWPKLQTRIYVRTNNNNDKTPTILKDWLARVGSSYLEVAFDDKDVEKKVERFQQHEWNGERFEVLGTIRNLSMQWAVQRGDHYFVADCDNFIAPDTLECLAKFAFANPEPCVVAPLLWCPKRHYSNFHSSIDQNGYFKSDELYNKLHSQTIKGLVQLPVVHCTYFVHAKAAAILKYLDGSGRYEYVIFSHECRRNNVPQYLDTRRVYGRVSFMETAETLAGEFGHSPLPFVKFDPPAPAPAPAPALALDLAPAPVPEASPLVSPLAEIKLVETNAESKHG